MNAMAPSIEPFLREELEDVWEDCSKPDWAPRRSHGRPGQCSSDNVTGVYRNVDGLRPGAIEGVAVKEGNTMTTKTCDDRRVEWDLNSPTGVLTITQDNDPFGCPEGTLLKCTVEHGILQGEFIYPEKGNDDH